MKKENKIISIVIFGILMLLFISFLLFKDNLVPKETIKFDQTSFGVSIEESFKIKYDSNNKDVIFYNGNEDIIDIDENGLVTAKQIGEVEVKVCLVEDKDICDTTKVIVFDKKESIKKIIINRSKEEMFIGNSITLDVKIEPENAKKDITWNSSNPDVAYIENGIIYAKSLGTTVITASSNDVSTSVEINVVKEKNYTVKFIIQDKKAINKDYVTVNCLANETNKECNINVPTFNVNYGYEVVGFSKTPNNSIINASKDEKINVNSNMEYYVVTRNKTPLDVSFIIQNDTARLVGNNSRCYFYNGNNTCEVAAPNIVGENGNRVLGWSLDKDAHEATIKIGDVIKVDRNTKIYSVTEKEITITYHEGYDIDGVNTKATKLSFNSNKHSKCISYNGEGCYIIGIPVIYSTGSIIHGFSLTKDGNSIEVLKTKFKDDTTLYARIHNDLDGKDVDSYKVAYETQVGNINIEIEKGITINGALTFINYLKELYKDHPELFYYDGKIVLLTEETYILYNGENSSGATWTDDYGFFSTAFIRFNNIETFDKRYLGTITHELGHCYDNKYKQIFGNNISKESDVVALYNKYVNSTNRPLSDYAYGDPDHYEFVAEALLEVYRLDKVKDNYEPYLSQMGNIYVTDDIKEMVHRYLAKGNNYLKEKGMLP